MAKSKTTIFYNSWLKSFNKLTDEQAGIICKELLRFSNGEPIQEEKISKDLTVDILFMQLSDIVKLENEKYEQRCAKNQQIAIEREEKKKQGEKKVW